LGTTLKLRQKELWPEVLEREERLPARAEALTAQVMAMSFLED
jgi:hypothetical protein